MNTTGLPACTLAIKFHRLEADENSARVKVSRPQQSTRKRHKHNVVNKSRSALQR